MAEVQEIKTTTVETKETHEEGRTSTLLTDILTIIGFAILFIIIIWGFVHLVSLISSSLSGSKTTPSITLNAPAQVTSEQSFAVSWNYSPTTQGTYAFLYQCENGLSFATKGLPAQAGATSSMTSISCGTAYTVGNVNSLTLTPSLAGTSVATDTVSVVFIPSESGTQVQGDATLTVNPAAKTTPTKPAASRPSTPSYTGPQYSGPADLSVRIISGNVGANSEGVVTFDIANIGGSPSGSYYFTAQLPTAQPYPYQSPLQTSLAPGAHITNTLNFSDVQSGGGTFSVTVLSNDSNTSDNFASMQLTAPYSNYNYNNNYYQQPYTVYPTYTY